MVHFNHDIAAPEELALHIDLVRGRDRDWGGVRGRGRGRGTGRGRGKG